MELFLWILSGFIAAMLHMSQNSTSATLEYELGICIILYGLGYIGLAVMVVVLILNAFKKLFKSIINSGVSHG